MFQSYTFRVLAFQAILFLPGHLFASPSQEATKTLPPSPPGVIWQSTSAQHAFGFPDTKPKKNGVLTLDATELNFKTKASNTSIPLTTITAVNAGNDRVELWGTGGRIMRMAIPNGGGFHAPSS